MEYVDCERGWLRAGDAAGRAARGGLGGGRLGMELDGVGSAREIGRIDGLGDSLLRFVELRRACASRKAATEIRCDVSDAMLPPRGRGVGDTKELGGDCADSCATLRFEGLGDASGTTWRKDMRWKDSAESGGRGASGAVSSPFGFVGLDFLRSRAQLKNPPLALDALADCSFCNGRGSGRL